MNNPNQVATEKMTINTTEAARVLGISRPTMGCLVRSAGFPAFQVGTRWLISVKGLQEWIDKQVQDESHNVL